jgi:preprotein translocase subunit SecF
MFLRVGVPLIIAGVFTSLLIGWAVAYWYDRKARREDAEREREEDQ